MQPKINPNNAMLIDIQYVRGDRKKDLPDYLYTIWKDLETDKKYVQVTESPKVPIYFEKPDRINHKHPVQYRELEDCDMHVCKYSDIPFEIANTMGDNGKNFIRNIFETRNFKELRMLNLYPYVFGHDYDIRTIYRYQWSKMAKKNVVPRIKKGFLDIEADSFDIKGFPNPTVSPIDLVTVIDGQEKVVYTFALVGRGYKPSPGIQKIMHQTHSPLRDRIEREDTWRREMYENRLRQEQELMDDLDGLNEELHELFDESYGKFEYKQFFYRDERQMLVHLFQLIHTISPDFLMIWNIGFDIPYIINRMKALGLDPEAIICDPEFPNRVCRFKKDTRNHDIKNKNDWFTVSSKTVYVDQMELYAAVRKGREELRSHKLTYVAEKEIGDGKLDYSEEGEFKTFSYRNYRKYFIYNIKDVLLQYGIEEATEDCETLYSDTYENITAYENNFKQTVVLRNVQYETYMQMGLVPGGNINQVLLQIDMEQHPGKYANKKKDPDYEGALVGNTKLIGNFGKEMYGKRTNYAFAYSIDMDMSAFYPSTIDVLNISACTMIFKVIMKADQYNVRGGTIPFHGFTDVQLVKENTDSFSGDIAGEVFDNFQTGNVLSTGHKFLNLPTVTEIESYLLKNAS